VPSLEEAQEGPAGTAAAARWGVRPRRDHESLRPLLVSGHRAEVHGNVPRRWVHVRRPWWGTPTVVGGGAMGSHGGVAVLAATTAVAAVVVPIPVVVAAVTGAGAAAVVLARRARRRQGRRQWSGRHFVGVERRRRSSWTGGVQVNFLHHGIHLDVEVGNDGVDIRRRSGRGRCGSGGQLLDGGLLLIKELTGGQDATTRGGLLLGSFGGGDQGIEPLLGDLDVGGRKGDVVRWHEDQRRGGGDQGVEPLLEGLGIGGRKDDDVRRHDDRRRGGIVNIT
jgi:hypothetical protein